MATTEEIIEMMREESTGNRAVFYENFGSGIIPVLAPLADLLEASQESHPDLVEQVAQKLYMMR